MDGNKNKKYVGRRKKGLTNMKIKDKETLKEMAQFFMKTSVPRILAEERNESK